MHFRKGLEETGPEEERGWVHSAKAVECQVMEFESQLMGTGETVNIFKAVSDIIMMFDR